MISVDKEIDITIIDIPFKETFKLINITTEIRFFGIRVFSYKRHYAIPKVVGLVVSQEYKTLPS